MSHQAKRPFDSVECSTPHDLLIRCSLSNLQFPAIALTWCGLTSHRHRSIEPFFMSLAARDSSFVDGAAVSTAGYVKLLLPPRQSRGNSHWGLGTRRANKFGILKRSNDQVPCSKGFLFAQIAQRQQRSAPFAKN